MRHSPTAAVIERSTADNPRHVHPHDAAHQLARDKTEIAGIGALFCGEDAVCVSSVQMGPTRTAR